jgi:probable rRNA maturation factor
MIEFNNRTAVFVNEEFLKEVAKKVLKSENKEKGSLSVAFVGEGRMRKLNKKYRNRNRTTDVLSFEGNLKSKLLPKEKPDFIKELGEVVICLKTVRKNAKRYGLDFEEELVRVLIHGILHLLGYEHERGGKEAEEMRKKEEYYLLEVFRK